VTLDEYVAWAASIGATVDAGQPDLCARLQDGLGFAAEVGEVAGVLTKWLRDGVLGRERLADELGDVAFYWARLGILTGMAPSTLLGQSRAHAEWRRAGRPGGGPASIPPGITLDEFVEWAIRPTDRSDDQAAPGDVGLAMAGDAGEVGECLRRLAGGDDPATRERLAGELGDVWRYWARLAAATGVAPGEVLARSRAKIEARLADRAW
jgi:NTP pyrophosphatase (non-canonical NTP hydrolase)